MKSSGTVCAPQFVGKDKNPLSPTRPSVVFALFFLSPLLFHIYSLTLLFLFSSLFLFYFHPFLFSVLPFLFYFHPFLFSVLPFLFYFHPFLFSVLPFLFYFLPFLSSLLPFLFFLLPFFKFSPLTFSLFLKFSLSVFDYLYQFVCLKSRILSFHLFSLFLRSFPLTFLSHFFLPYSLCYPTNFTFFLCDVHIPLTFTFSPPPPSLSSITHQLLPSRLCFFPLHLPSLSLCIKQIRFKLHWATFHSRSYTVTGHENGIK
ncbi:unnamed protein product [Acanthosepion pharaonis]|uniref:Uncharacterized protein n=1 Tax=Acanthosepion pharaonis TaxID=158019 RepID=A0A812DZ63_ACAPH|nr:unnamed protein product [Sepia pharaonis]